MNRNSPNTPRVGPLTDTRVRIRNNPSRLEWHQVSLQHKTLHLTHYEIVYPKLSIAFVHMELDDCFQVNCIL